MKNIFETSDLGLASTLKYKGYKFLSCEREEAGKRYNFIFEMDEAEKLKLIEDYFLRRVQVEPIAFSKALKEMKTLLKY